VTQALDVVGFQNDFCPGGALAVPDGDAIAGRVNALAASGDSERALVRAVGASVA
jgi:nicotinamidase/pyrazinamidase